MNQFVILLVSTFEKNFFFLSNRFYYIKSASSGSLWVWNLSQYKIGNFHPCNLWTHKGREIFHFIFSSICINHPIALLCFSQWWYLIVSSNSARIETSIDLQNWENTYHQVSNKLFFYYFLFLTPQIQADVCHMRTLKDCWGEILEQNACMISCYFFFFKYIKGYWTSECAWSTYIN